jgi:Mrp family chromosome partitioning ATPase
MQECRPVASGGLFALLHPECAHPYVEQFHQLRTQMLLHRTRLEALTDLRAITVMSTQRGEGKSFTATNLAAMMAAGSGERVLLVDANPEGPELPTGINGLSAGLSQALAEPSQWAQSVYTVKDSRLSLMPRGRVPGRSIDFAPLPRLLTQLRRHFEWIILDGTSFATSPDAEWLSSAADGTLLVAQGGTAKFDATTESLVRIPADRMLGVVFNNRPPQRGAFKVRIRFTGKW